MKLAKCPCGKIPLVLVIEAANTYRYGYVYGDCCHDWIVEFKRNTTMEIDSPENIKLATEAWNNAPRGEQHE